MSIDTVHPHTRGDNMPASLPDNMPAGSPPRVRVIVLRPSVVIAAVSRFRIWTLRWFGHGIRVMQNDDAHFPVRRILHSGSAGTTIDATINTCLLQTDSRERGAAMLRSVVLVSALITLFVFGSGSALAERTQLFGRRGLGDTYSGVEAEMSAQDPAMTCCNQFDSVGPVALVMKDVSGQPFIEGGNGKVWRPENNRFELHPY